MDVRLPDGDGIAACREIKVFLPDVRILFLTSYADNRFVLAAMEAGAEGYLLKESGTRFDPTLLKIFINMIGVYPLGTFVQLDTGEMGLVFHNSNDPGKYDRPRVKLVMDSQGNKIPSRIVDLGEQGGGGFKRSIVKSVDPTKYNLNVPSYLLA